MSDIEKAYQATPAATLEQQITDPNFPKNEREWWAAARIERLEKMLRDSRAEVLEEAAKCADRNAAEAWQEGAEETRGLMRLQAADIAAAIRALKEKT